MENEKYPFTKWFKNNVVDWGDPESEYYEWPLRDDAPPEIVVSYMAFLSKENEARNKGIVID